MPEHSPPRPDFDIFADNGLVITINRPSVMSGLPRDLLAVRVSAPSGRKFESSGRDPFALMDAAMAWIRDHDDYADREPAPWPVEDGPVLSAGGFTEPAEGGSVPTYAYVDSQTMPMTRQREGVWFWEPSGLDNGVIHSVNRIEQDTALQNLIHRLGGPTA